MCSVLLNNVEYPVLVCVVRLAAIVDSKKHVVFRNFPFISFPDKLYHEYLYEKTLLHE